MAHLVKFTPAKSQKKYLTYKVEKQWTVMKKNTQIKEFKKKPQNNKWIAKKGYDKRHMNQRIPQGTHWNFAEDCWSFSQVFLYMLIDF